MSDGNLGSYHTNAYYAQAHCEHCEGIIRHQIWCQTLNPTVRYARKILVSPTELTIGDTILLHSLGVLGTGATPAFSDRAREESGELAGRPIPSLQSVLTNIGSTLEGNQ